MIPTPNLKEHPETTDSNFSSRKVGEEIFRAIQNGEVHSAMRFPSKPPSAHTSRIQIPLQTLPVRLETAKCLPFSNLIPSLEPPSSPRRVYGGKPSTRSGFLLSLTHYLCYHHRHRRRRRHRYAIHRQQAQQHISSALYSSRLVVIEIVYVDLASSDFTRPRPLLLLLLLLGLFFDTRSWR